MSASDFVIRPAQSRDAARLHELHAAFYVRSGFREVERSTVKRNGVDVPVIVMEYHAAEGEP